MASSSLLQYLVACPACLKPGAVHVGQGCGTDFDVVRFVCPDGCIVDERAIRRALTAGADGLQSCCS